MDGLSRTSTGLPRMIREATITTNLRAVNLPLAVCTFANTTQPCMLAAPTSTCSFCDPATLCSIPCFVARAVQLNASPTSAVPGAYLQARRYTYAGAIHAGQSRIQGRETAPGAVMRDVKRDGFGVRGSSPVDAPVGFQVSSSLFCNGSDGYLGASAIAGGAEYALGCACDGLAVRGLPLLAHPSSFQQELRVHIRVHRYAHAPRPPAPVLQSRSRRFPMGPRICSPSFCPPPLAATLARPISRVYTL